MIQIREMQVRDTNAVAEIERQIFSQPWSRQGFLDAVNLGNTVFLVAEENNRIIGYIGMYLAMDEGEITNVAVAPVERCHGVGGMLPLRDSIELEKEKSMLDVCLLGTAGMMPLPHRWLTAALMRYNGSNLLIDCGEGTQIAIKEKGWTFKPIDVICFTHYHADHISGLPGLLLTMGNAERTEPLTMIGPKGLEKVVSALRMIAPELPFEIRYIELTGPEEDMEINGYHIHAFKVNHNISCYGYTVEIRRAGRFDVERARNNHIPQKLWNPLQKGQTVTTEDGITFTPDMVLGAPRKGIKVTYCTDTRPTENIVKCARHSDLFICEGMYAEKDKIAKAKQYKHMTFYEAADMAKRAGVEEMWLTHFSPSLVHAEDYMPEVKKIFPNAYLGKDGKSVELLFDENE